MSTSEGQDSDSAALRSLEQALAGVDFTDPDDAAAETVLSAVLDRQLSKATGRSDQSALSGRLARLRARLADCASARACTGNKQTRDLLTRYELLLHTHVLMLVQHLDTPIHGLPGGFVLAPSEDLGGGAAELHDDALGGMLTPSQIPGCRQQHQPAWRRAAAAEQARELCAQPEQWVVRWSPVVPAPDLACGYRLLDEDCWQATGSPSVMGRDHFAAHPWPTGAIELHVIAVPDEVTRRDIAAAYAPIVADQWGLTAIPADWLHVTVWSGLECGHATAADIAYTVRVVVDGVPAMPLSVGPATLNADGVQLDLVYGAPTLSRDPLGQLVERVRSALRPSGHPAPFVLPRFWRPHLAVAYNCANVYYDATGVNHIRRRWAWTLDHLDVVAMTQDPAAGIYRWETLHTITLPPQQAA